jgi:glycosyltransferase involved in cell wall biosynthesis
MKISLIQPGRNNLKYLKWSYDSIRKNQGDHEVEICVADDASTDGTWDWCLEMMDKDPLFKAHCNEGPDRLGHTILYDTLINDIATNDIAMIYHADMYLCPGALDAIEREIEEKTIVSLTRIEPPLHPDGPEKVLLNCGVEPEEFKEQVVLDWVEKNGLVDKITEGIFAPWAFYRKDFQEIGGHDPLYAPQSKEDSDIFNRFQLNGVKFKQVWDGFVYHMTCRGSRRNTNDKAVNIHTDSPEWLAQNQRSTRNFIRKWGHFVKHDSLMKPIVPNKYNVGIWIHNCNFNLLSALEPWGDSINVVEMSDKEVTKYINSEQPNTVIPIGPKINTFKKVDVFVKVDGKTFNNNDFEYIQQLSQILDESGAPGQFELGNLFINIREFRTYTENLIKL